MRKKWIKAYLIKEQRGLLRRIGEGFGIGERNAQQKTLRMDEVETK